MSIFAYFTRRLNKIPTRVKFDPKFIEGIKSLRELPLKSECGKDCMRVINAARVLMDVSDEGAHDEIRTAALSAVMIYWVG